MSSEPIRLGVNVPSASDSVGRRAREMVRRYLPRGDALPDLAWQTRHRALLILLWLHVAGLPIVGIMTDHGAVHSLLEGGLVALAAVAASVREWPRSARMVATTLGLVTSSALLVHFSGGLIEFHFHFFVIVAVITLYQSWLPFSVALIYVVLHHSVMGTIDPMTVYNHPAAIASPWKWALVHGLFILGESAALLVVWRLNEDARAQAEESYEERLREEQARREAQDRYRDIFENSIEGIYEARFGEGFITANPAFARMVGFASVDELRASTTVAEETLNERPDTHRLLALLEEHDSVHGFEHELPGPEGGSRWLSNTARAVRNEEGQLVGIQGSVEDITDRKQAEIQRRKLEDQLRQAQKMEAIGQLAGGIAHDFNNILAVVTNYAAFLEEDLDEDDPRRQDAEEIRAAGERGAKLVHQILTFSRKEIVDPEVLDLNRCISDMENMLRRSLGEDVALDLREEEELLHVRVDRSQIEQVLVNLAINARDAMKQGGKLIVRTTNARFDETISEQHAEMPPGDYVCMSVSDSGSGMSAEVKARVFEPFFTTKPKGEGTGLGLSMVYGAVKRAGGYVYVYSEQGMGTTCRIYLPAIPAEDASGGDRPETNDVTPGRCARVLLVEDEPAVRELTRRILERGGYEVIVASGGDEATLLWQEPGLDIDLLLTDVIMPGMSGKELDMNLRSIRNGFKTLFMSGYTDEIVAERGMLDEREELIQKPFSAYSLLSKVQKVLTR